MMFMTLDSDGTIVNPFIYTTNSPLKINYLSGVDSGTTVAIGGTTTLSLDTWYHVAIVRSSGVTKLFLNGVAEAAGVSDPNSYAIGAAAPVVGAKGGGSFPFSGYMNEIRISKGTDRGWFSGFTPPSSPYSDDSQPGPGIDSLTRLLLPLDGADASTTMADTVGSHTCTAVGNAQLDTAQFKFGSAAVLLDGDDGIEVASHADWAKLAGSNFVFDCFVRFSALPASGQASQIVEFGSDNWVMGIFDTGQLVLYYRPATSAIISGSILSLDTWYHVALVMSEGAVRLFLDGVQDGGTADTASVRAADLTNGPWRIGNRHSDNVHGVIGWIDEFRLSIGTDRAWWGGFTPPGAAYQAGLSRSQATIIG
jgi:hypothetical protein